MMRCLGITQNNKEVFLLYLEREGENLFFKANASSDGFTFDDYERSKYIFVFDKAQKEEQHFDWTNIRIVKHDHEYILTYKQSSKKSGPLSIALSPDLTIWYKLGEVDGVTETGAIVPDYKYNDNYVIYAGETAISLATSKDLLTWEKDTSILLTSRKGYFDDGNLEVGNAFIHDGNILLLYYVKRVHGEKVYYDVGAAYFDKNDPTQLLWRSDEPLYSLAENFQKETTVPLGSVLLHDQIILYWSLDGATLFSVNCPIPVISDLPQKQRFSVLVKKHHNNPIISPRPHVPWESRATFNSAAILADGKVHFLYRALGDTDLSVLGYATSSDGLTIDYRSDTPAYIPREPFETPGNHAFSTLAQHFVSGGGYGGIEDPRITQVDNKVYLTYVAFDGATPPRAAISSISVSDFVKNDWEKWAKPKLISAPGMVNKSAVVMPRKIRGKYVVMHRVYPNILVDYVDNLEFDSYLQGHYFIPPRKGYWDSKKVGAGAPPMETKDGWLLIYQSVGYQDPSRYKIGAMMLDRDNPEKVLYRTHVPIIEPVESYENNGFKAGVVYPCGSVIMKDKLYIYYGGADSYLNAASADVDNFLYEMKHNQEPKVQMVRGNIN